MAPQKFVSIKAQICVTRPCFIRCLKQARSYIKACPRFLSFGIILAIQHHCQHSTTFITPFSILLYPASVQSVHLTWWSLKDIKMAILTALAKIQLHSSTGVAGMMSPAVADGH